MKTLVAATLTGVVGLLVLPGLAPAEDSPPSGEQKNARRFVRVPAPDGISIKRLNRTDGEMPDKKDRVIVEYHGTLKDGTVFDSTRGRGPASFALDKVVPCWTEALTRLRVGEKAEVRCPPRTAYGSEGSPPRIPGNATLDFEVEILAIP